MAWRTLKNIGKNWSIVIGRKHEASAPDDMAVDGDAGAPELVGIVIPELGNSALWLQAERWLLGIDSSDVALSFLPSSAAAFVGGSGAEEDEKAESWEEGCSHGWIELYCGELGRIEFSREKSDGGFIEEKGDCLGLTRNQMESAILQCACVVSFYGFHLTN